MSREMYEDMMSTCASNLQGSYGRLYYDWYLQQPEEIKDEFCGELEDNNVTDLIGFIMYMEA